MRFFSSRACTGVLILACCLSLGLARGEEDLFGLSADSAPEELYWEVLRLRSGEVLSEQTFAQVQRELDVVDAHYAADRDHDEQVRRVLVGALRRTYRTVPGDESAPLHAAQEGRAYARRLHSAGAREGEKYAQRTVFIAGMLGMPTSKGELALIVALPAGGYLVGKIAALTYKKAALLLRNLRTPDEVLSRAGALGVRVQRVESKTDLERVLGREAGAGVDAAPRAPESVTVASKGKLPSTETWGDSKTLDDHFKRHGSDFGSRSATEYAERAADFLAQAQRQGLPTKVDSKGVVRVYDPRTNTFGAYNPNSTTRTFYKPDPAQHGYPTNLDYWNAQPGQLR